MTPGRREVLLGAAGLLMTSAARAQSSDPITALQKLGIGDELLSLLPGKPLDIVRVLATILTLETEADQRNLPQSALSFKSAADNSTALPTTQGGLYTTAVPRLIRVRLLLRRRPNPLPQGRTYGDDQGEDASCLGCPNWSRAVRVTDRQAVAAPLGFIAASLPEAVH